MCNFTTNPNTTLITVFRQLNLKHWVWKCNFVVSLNEWVMKLRNINAVVCIVWSLTYLNIQCSFILESLQMQFLQRIYRKENYRCLSNVAVGNCITGDLERVWRNVKSDGAVTEKVQCAGAWYRQDSAICALLWDLSFTKYICVYLCTVSLSGVCCIIQSYILSAIYIESK